MQKYWNTVQDEHGNPRYGASVAVQQNGINSTIYSDSAGTIPRTNPLTTDATRGYFEFYAAAGTYDLVIFGVGFASYTITNGAQVGLPSGDVTFIQSGTGAVAGPTQNELRRTFYAEQFGAAADGVTDDASAITKALAAAGLGGRVKLVPGKTYLCTSTITVGGGATIAHELSCDGRATLKFNITGHTTDGVVLQGYNQNTIYGRTFWPVYLKGMDINMQNTGRDGWLLKETDHGVIEDVAVIQPYRNAHALTPSANTWIENCRFKNILASKCGHHAWYFGILNSNSYINDNTFENCEVRGVGINSVALGINAGTQPKQLGAAIYAISFDTVNGLMDGQTWIQFAADCGSSYAVANSSQPNPNAIMFADGQTAHVIEGAGVASAKREFDRWAFYGSCRIEDTASGGFTTGFTVNVDTTNVIVHGLEIGLLSGGTWSAMSATVGTAAGTGGNYVKSADAPGGICSLQFSGQIDLSVGLAATGNGQVKFPSTQNASTGATTLDDYQEKLGGGTPWTPSLGGTTTYTTQDGEAIKVGRIVYFRMCLVINTIGSGNVSQISGLPFTAETTPSGNPSGACTVAYHATTATSSVWLGAFVGSAGTTITMVGKTAASTDATASFSTFTNSTRVDLNGWYIAAN